MKVLRLVWRESNLQEYASARAYAHTVGINACADGDIRAAADRRSRKSETALQKEAYFLRLCARFAALATPDLLAAFWWSCGR